MIIDVEVSLGILTNPADPRRDEWVDKVGERVLARAGVNLTDRDVIAGFAEVVRRGLIEEARRKLDRFQERHGQTHHDVLFDVARPPAITLKELKQTYLAEREQDFALNGVSQKRLDKVTALANTLLEIVGDATPVHAIDDDVIQRVRSVLSSLPSNRLKLYPKLPVEKAMERAAKDGKPTLSAETQRQYLEILRDLLNVAVRKKLLPANPAAHARPLKKDNLSAAEKRLPWTADQVCGFFMGGFYRSCAPGAPVPYSKPDRAPRFWVPLIMLLTGARPNEICQLTASDIQRTEAGTWFMSMTDEGDKTLKTKASRRRVPIHPEMIRIGFLAFVAECRKAEGRQRLFPGLKSDKYGNLASYTTRRLNETFIPAEIQLGDRQVLYSLRHNVRDALRRVKAPPETLKAIAGWSPAGKAVSDDYGDAGNPDHHIEYVEKIRYPDLDLSFLHLPLRAGLSGAS